MLKGASLAVDIFSNCVFIIYVHALPRTGTLLFFGRGVVLSKESNVFHRIRSFAAMLALGGVLISAPVSAAEKPVDIPFMGCYVEEHPVVTSVWKAFFEEAEAKFAGKIAFSYYAENMLYSSQAESSQGIFDGRAAFGAIRPAMHPDEFRLLGVINIPGLVPNAVVGSLVLADIIDHFPAVRAEFPKNTEHFTSWTSASYQMHTKSPVHSLKDLQGKNIVVWDAVSHTMVREMGANPVMVSPPRYVLDASARPCRRYPVPAGPSQGLSSDRPCEASPHARRYGAGLYHGSQPQAVERHACGYAEMVQG